MGKIKELLEQEWENLKSDAIHDIEYLEWASEQERAFINHLIDEESEQD